MGGLRAKFSHQKCKRSQVVSTASHLQYAEVVVINQEEDARGAFQ